MAIVVIDLVSLLLILAFINVITHMQTDFAKQFDVETVEMRDFSVKTNTLPAYFSKCKDEVQLKFEIWK